VIGDTRGGNGRTEIAKGAQERSRPPATRGVESERKFY